MSTTAFGFIAGIVLGLSLGMAGLFDNAQICVSMQRNDVYETSAPSLFHRMLQRPIDVPKEDDAYGVSHGKQHYLWITPVSVWKLRNSEKMNRDIYERVKKGYSSFKSEKSRELGKDRIFQSSSAKGINELFFSMQRNIWEDQNQWWDVLEDSPFAQRLKATIWERASIYMSRLGRGNVNASKLFLWATACESCISHLPHVHEDSLISGTYYVNVRGVQMSLVSFIHIIRKSLEYQRSNVHTRMLRKL